jgi:hypothetical protein
MTTGLTLEDGIAMHDLISKYAWALSTGDVEGFVELFTDDGGIEDKGSGRAGTGPDGMRFFIAGALAKVQGCPRQYMVDHVAITPGVDDPDKCTVRPFWQIIRSVDGRATPFLIGHYDDTCVKTGGKWRFALRVATPWRKDAQPWVASGAQAPARQTLLKRESSTKEGSGQSCGWQSSAPKQPGTGSITSHDWVELHQLLSRYSWALDTGDIGVFPAIFTEHAWVDDLTTGRLDFFTYARTMISRPGHRGLMHCVSQPLIEGNNDRCAVRSFWMIVRETAEKHADIERIGYILDECVKVDGSWRFASRVVRPWQGEWVPWASPESAAAAEVLPSTGGTV